MDSKSLEKKKTFVVDDTVRLVDKILNALESEKAPAWQTMSALEVACGLYFASMVELGNAEDKDASFNEGMELMLTSIADVSSASYFGAGKLLDAVKGGTDD